MRRGSPRRTRLVGAALSRGPSPLLDHNRLVAPGFYERIEFTPRESLQQPALGSQDMLIIVHVTPNAKRAHVLKVNEAHFEVKVDEKATGGRANKRLVEILSEHLSIPKSRIVIVSGAKSRDKVLEVDSP